MIPSPSLENMFSPKGVAVVGASNRGGLFGRPLKFLTQFGYEGEVYPVNPRYEELEGIQCYPSLDAVPGPVDLAILMVPATAAVELVETCGRLGIPFVAVLASGFAETGREGRELQDRLIETAARAGVRVLGPNCQGVIYQPSRLAATFTAGIDRGFGASSGIAYVGQSGAVGGSVLDRARERGSDLTAWVSTGNQADLDLLELTGHLLGADTVEVCMCYLEELGDGGRFINLAKQANALQKHLVVLRSGRTATGKRAVTSHTGGLLGPDPGFDLVAEQYGVTVVADVDEMIDAAIALRYSPRLHGHGVGIVTSSGGAGSLLADHLDGMGLTVPELAAETQGTISGLVPAFGSATNPVDITAQLTGQLSVGDSSAFDLVCRAVVADAAVDVLAIVLTMPSGDAARRLATDIANVAGDVSIPVLVAWLAGDERTREGRTMLREAGVAVFPSVGSLARAARVLIDRTKGFRAPDDFDEVGRAEQDQLRQAFVSATSPGATGEELLDALGIARPRSVLATDSASAAAFARDLGAPVAVKAIVPGEIHKTDVGAVILGVEPDRVAETFDELVSAFRHRTTADAAMSGVLVQEMVPPGLELLVSARASRLGYPPIVTVGLGGVAAELYRDVAAMPAPGNRRGALELLRSLRCFPLFLGYRGGPPVDVEAVIDVMMSLGTAAVVADSLFDEIEINPIIVGPPGAGLVAVDIVVTPPNWTVPQDAASSRGRRRPSECPIELAEEV